MRQKANVKEGSVRVGMPGWKILYQGRKDENENGRGEGAADEEGKKENGQADGLDKTQSPGEGNTTTTETQSNIAPNASAPSPQTKSQLRNNSTSIKRAIIFDEKLGRDPPREEGRRRLIRYQINPRANWGPMNRAKRRVE